VRLSEHVIDRHYGKLGVFVSVRNAQFVGSGGGRELRCDIGDGSEGARLRSTPRGDEEGIGERSQLHRDRGKLGGRNLIGEGVLESGPHSRPVCVDAKRDFTIRGGKLLGRADHEASEGRGPTLGCQEPAEERPDIRRPRGGPLHPRQRMLNDERRVPVEGSKVEVPFAFKGVVQALAADPHLPEEVVEGGGAVALEPEELHRAIDGGIYPEGLGPTHEFPQILDLMVQYYLIGEAWQPRFAILYG